ncbi:hypothetical protein DFH07DRAFT_951751 [Mycena maculata]|uniref:Protein kinase domain-containing protein n=1 Tax=Mycena maculata TaxID=230809 RepID=A0AAD7K4S0_9AGAR|nr:hypothetical protein DFH07DRAFT_951751 [Mycena maculata]
MPKAPFQIGAHDRAPPTTAPLPGMDPRIRGVGQSDLQPLVPSAQPTPSALPRCPFVALLVAINAPRGALAFEPPDRLLTKDAYAQYVAAFPPMPPAPSSAGPSSSSQIVSFDPPRGSARSLPSTDPEQLTIKFGLPLSQDPQLLRKLSRSHINEAKSGRFSPSLPLDGPSSFLSLDSVIPSGEQASVHRGTLDGDRPVIAKLYDACNFDALLREVDAYECMTLSSAVPKCLGVFGPSHRAWAALILEDKGEPLVARWQDLSLEDRIAVYKAAAEVHAAGVLHGDLERRNFIRHQDGGLYAIDFGHSTVEIPKTWPQVYGSDVTTSVANGQWYGTGRTAAIAGHHTYARAPPGGEALDPIPEGEDAGRAFALRVSVANPDAARCFARRHGEHRWRHGRRPERDVMQRRMPRHGTDGRVHEEADARCGTLAATTNAKDTMRTMAVPRSGFFSSRLRLDVRGMQGTQYKETVMTNALNGGHVAMTLDEIEGHGIDNPSRGSPDRQMQKRSIPIASVWAGLLVGSNGLDIRLVPATTAEESSHLRANEYRVA